MTSAIGLSVSRAGLSRVRSCNIVLPGLRLPQQSCCCMQILAASETFDYVG